MSFIFIRIVLCHIFGTCEMRTFQVLPLPRSLGSELRLETSLAQNTFFDQLDSYKLYL